MFNTFVQYRLQNKKITYMVIWVILLWWLFSRFSIPKQYNPDIIVPAFQIVIPAPGYSSAEIEKLIVTPLERKIKEIADIDTIQSVAHRDYAASMIMFTVGTDKEEAYTRLRTKLQANMDTSPLGIHDIQIKPIDPDEIPVYTIALQIPKDSYDSIAARHIATEMIQYIQNIESVGTIYVVGGTKDTITAEIDPSIIESMGTDIMQVYEALVKNSLTMPWWSFTKDERSHRLIVDANPDSIESLEHIIVATVHGTPIYLWDIATLYHGVAKQKDTTFFFPELPTTDATVVYIGIAKKKWTNAVDVVHTIETTLSAITPKLPTTATMTVIQNEWETARLATDKLLHELLMSVVVLFIVMFVFLWRRDALSSVFAIPLVLAIVFGVSLILGDNVNRITLFALILVLGMLVDDSIIVVENISRHLATRAEKNLSVQEAILAATKEIWWAALFSTITKIISFSGMFFVSGMMGQYMGPIPKYAIIALTASLFVAFSINPFLSYIFSTQSPPKRISRFTNFTQQCVYRWKCKYSAIRTRVRLPDFFSRTKKNTSWHSHGTLPTTWILWSYVHFLQRVLQPGEERRRRLLKCIFRCTLIVFLVVFPALGIFRWRMLPKSDVNQIYLWLDAPAGTAFTRTETIAKDTVGFLSSYTHTTTGNTVSELSIIETISSRVGIAPTPDFSNTFRWSMMRQGEHYISMRINLLPKEERDISSESFVIAIRPMLQKRLATTYPGTTMRLLEDPPWPPVMSTFEVRVQSQTTTTYSSLETISARMYQKLYPILRSDDVVDHGISLDNYTTDIIAQLDHEAMSKAWLNAQQVAATVYAVFGGYTLTPYHDQTAIEPVTIALAGPADFTRYQDLTFTNPQWQKIPLGSIAKIIPTAADLARHHYDGKPTVTIYGEMWNNSVIYPMIRTIVAFLDDSFWEGKFEVVDRNLYGFTLRELGTEATYYVSFGGEWELSMDTFKDLWTALIISLLLLYFLVSARFKSFGLGGIVMLPFLLWFLGVLPWFSVLYLLQNEYFSATSMIGVIALAGIAVGNSIILLEYVEELRHEGMSLAEALIKASYIRLKPIALTSLTAIFGALMIIGDPVRSGLGWALVRWLSVSAFLTLLLVPIFVYDNQNHS
jgi:multidrug efflux pump subunit AcrB